MFPSISLTPNAALSFSDIWDKPLESTSFLSNSLFELSHHGHDSKPTSPQLSDASAPLHFTSVNKMSLYSLEKRIDYHLSRIMKGHRLINFKNSIERLPTEKRICECIIEVLISSLNLITRKTKIISESKAMADYLLGLAEQTKKNCPSLCGSADYCHRYVLKLGEVKSLAIGLEQIIWALNSNKEHIKYIVKVFMVPEMYRRSEFSSDANSVVPLRASITKTIDQCEDVITVCRLLRAKLSDALIKWYISHL